MQNFIYSIPTKVAFGKGMVDKLPGFINEFGNQVLLVYGGGSIKRIGLYDQIISLLDENGIGYYELSGVEPNPRLSTVKKGIEICKKNNISVVLPVGGGSTIDCAKAIAAGYYYDGDMWDLVFDSEWLKPGCTLISSSIMEISREFISKHMTKVVDNIQMYENYIKTYQYYDEITGERISTGSVGMFFVNMVEDGMITNDDIHSLGDIIRGITPGRTSEEEMFLISAGGMPVSDIAWGYECYKKALSV